MDFESPDVEKDFPGLYASDAVKRNQSRDSDYSDDEKISKKDLLGKKKDKKDSRKDKGYMAFEGESSEEEVDETKSPGKIKKNRSTFKFPGKDRKEKHLKQKDKEAKEKKDDDKETKITKRDSKDCKKDNKDLKKIKTKEKKKIKNNILKTKEKKKKGTDQCSAHFTFCKYSKAVFCCLKAPADERPIFGVPLQEAVERSKSHDGIEIPVIVRECIDYIEEHGLACEGIYRISGVKSKVRHLKNQYNQGEKVYLYEHEPHIVAVLLKEFFRDLPEPILTKELVPQFEEAGALKNDQKKIETLMKLIESLPNCNRLLLSWIFIHMLHVVKLEKTNKMNLQNISIVLSPILKVSHRVLNALFSHSDILFKGVEIKKYIPPIEPDSSRLSLELPDSPTAIEDELCKQENLLNIIHEELNAGLRDTEKEEQLWEVQRVVTQLKRKLRFLRQIEDATKPKTSHIDQNEIESSNVNPSDIPRVHESPVLHNETINDDQLLCKSKSASTKTLDAEEDTLSSKLENVERDTNEDLKLHLQNAVEVNDSGQPIPINHGSPSADEEVVEPPTEERVVNMSEEIMTTESTEICNGKILPSSMPSKSLEVVNVCEMLSLHREEIRLKIQEEEFLLLGDELRRKINSEKIEIERLRQEILEYQKLYKYRFSIESTENSSSSSDDSSVSEENDDNEYMVLIFEDLLSKNDLLERKNAELSKKIQEEREACVNLKVQIKMTSKEPECIQM